MPSTRKKKALLAESLKSTRDEVIIPHLTDSSPELPEHCDEGNRRSKTIIIYTDR